MTTPQDSVLAARHSSRNSRTLQGHILRSDGLPLALSQDEFATLFSYTGRPLDTDSFLSYHRARDLDTCTGRFLSPDPLLDGTNFFAYTHGDFVNNTDPSGYFANLNKPGTPEYEALEASRQRQIRDLTAFRNSPSCSTDNGLADHVDRMLALVNPKFKNVGIEFKNSASSDFSFMLGHTTNYDPRKGIITIYKPAAKSSIIFDETIQHELTHWLYGDPTHKATGDYTNAQNWGGWGGKHGIYGEKIFDSGR